MTDPKVVAAQLAMIAGLISTPVIRDFSISMMTAAPNSFRNARASLSHHPPDEREPGGNCLHTIRVVKLAKLLADACDCSRLSADILVSAAIIHDICRYGLDDKDEATTKEHTLAPRLLAERHSITCEYADAIFTVAENHMGRWGPIPYTPKVALSDLLHFSDAISAHANEVWEQLGSVESSWLGTTPFQSQGMTQEKMNLMEELAEDSEYWKVALSFIRSVSTRKVDTLSEKQQDWIENIISSLAVELDRSAARGVFEE